MEVSVKFTSSLARISYEWAKALDSSETNGGLSLETLADLVFRITAVQQHVDLYAAHNFHFNII